MRRLFLAAPRLTMQHPQPEKEKHSYANTAHVRTTNVSLHVDLDFTRKALHGFVELTLAVRALMTAQFPHLLIHIQWPGAAGHIDRGTRSQADERLQGT